jgi:GT2 family glycosyltransferase
MVDAVDGDTTRPRPRIEGKFIAVGATKLYVRGATYGTFSPDHEGCQYGTAEQVERDFACMVEHGINTVRVYTVPPRWLLDLAQRHGLYVLVGIPWEQHVAFLDDRKRVRSIVERIRQGVRACSGHPAVLAYAVGNEIPAPIVRWHGRRRIERFIERLYRAAKREDPAGLVTYVSYPSTEFLCLPFLDFVCFNVYLESRERLVSYLARLQNIAGDRPLVMAEVGLDSRRNGLTRQAEVLDWQIRATFAAGCAGLFIFSWTDEWFRGGHDIADWDFGLVDRQRRPKPALLSLRCAFAEVPFPAATALPKVSVVVCTHNGSRTIRNCLEGLARLEYPDVEVIVVDDGSTDDTAAIASEYSCLVVSTKNYGLSSARNIGLALSTGEIIAYTDDDARPDRHWLSYLVSTFLGTDHVGVGGPNIPPRGDGMIAECIANAPGGPIHVLLSDQEAEHIPGCNMAFRREALTAIGGFDPRFRAAGDDVDICWRLSKRGWTIGFNPAAFVWHSRRNSIRTYWRQQRGYGRAEALLEQKWPERYNAAGHVTWTGRLYGHRLEQAISRRRGAVYHGTWGTALFQSLYHPAPTLLWSLPAMPEWYLALLLLGMLSSLGGAWKILYLALPLLVLGLTIAVVQAGLAAGEAVFPSDPQSRLTRFALRTLTAFLTLVQPIARLAGRLRHGLSPWRPRHVVPLRRKRASSAPIWCERWQSPESRLAALETALQEQRAATRRGGGSDTWDLQVSGGLLGGVRAQMAVEEHGAGRQLVRVRCRAHYPAASLVLVPLVLALSAAAFRDGAEVAGVVLLGMGLAVGSRMFYEWGGALAVLERALQQVRQEWTAAGPQAAPVERLRRLSEPEVFLAEAVRLVPEPVLQWRANGGTRTESLAKAETV